MYLPADLVSWLDTMSALRLLLGIVAPTHLSLPPLQAITRVSSLATVDPIQVSTSLLTFIHDHPPTLPTPSTPSIIIAQLARSADTAGKWANNKRDKMVHDLCYARPALIQSPRALKVYHRLFVIRRQFCPGRPQFLDSIPRPEWRSRPRRFPPALAIPPLPVPPPPVPPPAPIPDPPPAPAPVLPPASRVLHSPTRTRLTSLDGPLPPQPGHPRPRRPPPASDKPLDPSPTPSPPAKPGHSWGKDAYAASLRTWLDTQARFLGLITRLRASISVRAWLIRLGNWMPLLEMPMWLVLGMVIGTVLGQLYLACRGYLDGRRSPPPPRPATPAPTSPRIARMVELSYRLEVRVYSDRSSRRIHKAHRFVRATGLVDKQSQLEAYAWVEMQRGFRDLELGFVRQRNIRFKTRIIRWAATWDRCMCCTKTYARVEHEPEVFKSLEELQAVLAGGVDCAEWHPAFYWSAPDSPTPSRPPTPLNPELRDRAIWVPVVEPEEIEEDGVDRRRWSSWGR